MSITHLNQFDMPTSLEIKITLNKSKEQEVREDYMFTLYGVVF